MQKVIKRREANKRSYLKRKGLKLCKLCGNIIPRGIRSQRYCSKACYKKMRKQSYKIFLDKCKKACWEYKLSQGCKICGYNQHAAALDFHHPENNKESPTTYSGFISPKVQREISKCIVVCSNCHRILHCNERN